MKAVLRTTWVYFAWFPAQRWLNVIGLLLLTLGFIYSPNIAFAGAVIIVIAPFLGGGLLLRALVGQRRSRLLPRARMQLFAGFFIAIFAANALCATTIALMSAARGGDAFQTGISALSLAWSLVSVFVIAQLLASRSTTIVWVPYAALMLLAQGVSLYLSKSSLPAWLLSSQLLLDTGAAVWVGFAVYFIKADIGLGIWARQSQASHERSTPFTRERMIWMLLGTMQWPRYQLAVQSGAALLLFALAYIMNRALNSGFSLIGLGAIAGVGFLSVGATAIQAASRSRTLWLRGYTRTQLFRVVERRCLRLYLPNIGLMAASLAGSALATPQSTGDLARVALAYSTLILPSQYVGLFVQRWTTGRLMFTYALVLCLVILLNTLEKYHGSVTFSVCIAACAILTALFTRNAAKRRWHYSDWCVRKPLAMGYSPK